MEIVRRPQAIRTHDGFCQPPHRDLVDAFHGAFSYAYYTLANCSFVVKLRSTELQKINREMQFIGIESLNFLLEPGKN